MIEKIKTITIAVLVAGIFAFVIGVHYGQSQTKALVQAAHASAVATTAK